MIDSSKVLAGIPAGLRGPLLETYSEIARNFVERRWEPSELNGGKFCEVVYTIVEGSIKGTFAATPAKPKNMLQSCRDLEAKSASASAARSLRILIPRLIPALYDIRNNRGVGHVGGDVNPNYLDATAVYGMASWILAELIRIFHNVTIKEAQETVDALVERKIPLIWEVENTKRVLDPRMPTNDQVLVLLYQNNAWVLEKDLVAWTEYSNATVFRDKVLTPLHKARKIEYDRLNARARISPTGSNEVERRVLKTRA